MRFRGRRRRWRNARCRFGRSRWGQRHVGNGRTIVRVKRRTVARRRPPPLRAPQPQTLSATLLGFRVFHQRHLPQVVMRRQCSADPHQVRLAKYIDLLTETQLFAREGLPITWGPPHISRACERQALVPRTAFRLTREIPGQFPSSAIARPNHKHRGDRAQPTAFSSSRPATRPTAHCATCAAAALRPANPFVRLSTPRGPSGARQLRLQQARRRASDIRHKLWICCGSFHLQRHFDPATFAIGAPPPSTCPAIPPTRPARGPPPLRSPQPNSRRHQFEVHVVLGIQCSAAHHRSERRNHQVQIVGAQSRRRHVHVAREFLECPDPCPF